MCAQLTSKYNHVTDGSTVCHALIQQESLVVIEQLVLLHLPSVTVT